MDEREVDVDQGVGLLLLGDPELPAVVKPTSVTLTGRFGTVFCSTAFASSKRSMAGFDRAPSRVEAVGDGG